MPTPYKLKVLNGIAKLKTFSDNVLQLFGIKDLGTQTGEVTDGYIDWSIQHLTKTTDEWNTDTTTILLRGQLGLEDTGNTTFKLKIGNGTDLWSALGYAGGGSGSAAWGTIIGTLSTQTDLQTALDGKVDENAAITGATKTKITYDSKGLVTSGTDATTADIADSSNKRYVTDAQLTVIGNTSNTNSGDETAARIGAIVNGATDYTTPLDADKIGIWDVVNSLFKSTTWANFKDTLKAYFDTKYIMLLMHNHTTYSPLDNTTYYFNSNLLTGAPATANTNRFFTFPRAMTLKEANLMTVQTVNGSGESATIYLYNVTTGKDVGAVGTFTNNAGASTVAAFNYTGLSLNVNNTSKYSWKIVTPLNYTTNPTNVISEFRSYWITT